MVSRPETDSGAPVDLRGLAGHRVEQAFRRFNHDVAGAATEVLSEIAARLDASTSAADELLLAFLSRRPLDDVAATLGCEASALEFFPRAFVQPVTEALVREDTATGSRAAETGQGPSSGGSITASCPSCGWPPQLAVLGDEPELRGRRWLVCALCSTEWTFQRTACPGCGETDSNRLEHHVSESWRHVRVEECGSCGTYIKAVDLRIDGAAVPLVDELASVELDLWASEKGLKKLQPNLLGL